MNSFYWRWMPCSTLQSVHCKILLVLAILIILMIMYYTPLCNSLNPTMWLFFSCNTILWEQTWLKEALRVTASVAMLHGYGSPLLGAFAVSVRSTFALRKVSYRNVSAIRSVIAVSLKISDKLHPSIFKWTPEEKKKNLSVFGPSKGPHIYFFFLYSSLVWLLANCPQKSSPVSWGGRDFC